MDDVSPARCLNLLLSSHRPPPAVLKPYQGGETNGPSPPTCAGPPHRAAAPLASTSAVRAAAEDGDTKEGAARPGSSLQCERLEKAVLYNSTPSVSVRLTRSAPVPLLGSVIRSSYSVSASCVKMDAVSQEGSGSEAPGLSK